MPPAACSLRLLGPPELRCGTAALLLEPQRPHQLLAYMAARGDWVRREQLAALFWPDRGETAARSNLRKVILLAHQALQAVAHDDAPPAIEDQGGALRWRVATDAAKFLQALECGHFAEAIGLYGGPLMRGLEGPGSTPFAEWLQFERSRFAERWREGVLSAARQASDPTQRIELAARILARDPLDEAAVRLLLASLTACGRQAEARRALSRYARRLVQETGLEASAELQALCEGVPAAAAAPRAAAAAFFGRSGELRGIEELVSGSSAEPLVIVGPGGVGKSRLLREAVRRFAPRRAHGAVCVDLHGLRNADALPEHIARTLGLPLVGASSPWLALSGRLRRQPMLLALDSFDFLNAAAPMIDRLQAECPALRIVISSRTRPNLAVARLLNIDGLTCPQADDHDIEAFDAVQLFAHHARRAKADFVLEDEADAVAQICRLVDGLPLALELAASWVRLFRCADIASDLQRDLELLRDADDEHASSITAILEQSWSLLVPRERQALALLAVFRGPFDRQAARAVAGASLAIIGALIDKSLLRVEGEARLSLHPLVQRFAEQRLHAGDGACTAQQARQRHAEHYSQVLAALALPSVDVNHSLATVGLDLENFCAAWQAGIELPDAGVLARCVAPMGHYLVNRGPHKLAMSMLDTAEPVLRQALPPRTSALVVLLRRRANLHYHFGELGRAEADAQRALELAGPGVDVAEQRRLLNLKGVLAWARGDLRTAQSAFELALQGSHDEKDPVLADLQGNLGLIAQAQGRFDEARQCFAAALAQHRRVGSQDGVVQQLMNLGTVCWALQQWGEVVRLMGEALTLARAIDFAEHRPYGLRVMGLALLELGDTAAARRCIDSALALVDEGAEPLQRTIVLATLCSVDLAENRLDAAAVTLRDAALAAVGGALAHDRIGVIRTWGALLFAQGRIESAAILWLFVAAHPSTLADERPKVQESLARARDRLAPDEYAACERKAGQLDLDTLLTHAVSLLAPVA